MGRTSLSEKLADKIEQLDRYDFHDADRDAIIDVVEDMDKATTTRISYLKNLRVLSREADKPLSDMTGEALDELCEEQADVREWADSTATNYESAATAFAHYHGLDADAINVTGSNDAPAVDERTVLSPQEFHELRDAATHQRDRAFIDFLGFCGQRIRVAQSLKVEHVDVDAGVWYMPDVEGLKGSDKVGTKRPLLAARKSLSQWLSLHPHPEPDSHVFCTRADTRGPDGEGMGQSGLRTILDYVAGRTDINKPTNPHALRHHFVTTAKTRHGLEDATIKHIIGHAASSNVMATTYRHLSDEHHVEEANAAFGVTQPDEQETDAPPVCPDCQTPLRPSVDSCPTAGCDERFTDTHTQEDELVALAQEIEQKQDRFEELAESLDMDV